MTKTERELCDASQEIGGICESAVAALKRRCSNRANETIGSTKY